MSIDVMFRLTCLSLMFNDWFLDELPKRDTLMLRSSFEFFSRKRWTKEKFVHLDERSLFLVMRLRHRIRTLLMFLISVNHGLDFKWEVKVHRITLWPRRNVRWESNQRRRQIRVKWDTFNGFPPWTIRISVSNISELYHGQPWVYLVIWYAHPHENKLGDHCACQEYYASQFVKIESLWLSLKTMCRPFRLLTNFQLSLSDTSVYLIHAACQQQCSVQEMSSIIESMQRQIHVLHDSVKKCCVE